MNNWQVKLTKTDLSKLNKNQTFSFIQNKAAKTIQNGCKNWLYKMYTNDGKIGINARIYLNKHLGKKLLYKYECI